MAAARQAEQPRPDVARGKGRGGGGPGRFRDRRFPSLVVRPPGWGPIMPARDVADGRGGTTALSQQI